MQTKEKESMEGRLSPQFYKRHIQKLREDGKEELATLKEIIYFGDKTEKELDMLIEAYLRKTYGTNGYLNS